MLSWISSPEPPTRSFIFLDRDGIINVDRPDYIKHWREFQFYPDALESLRWLSDHGINVILISNQSALNRGITEWEDFWNLHNCMVQAIRNAGGDILAAFYCPHRPDENCSCRKPAPGMILAASRLYRIDLERTYLVGDRITDVEAAKRAGCKAVLLNRSPEHRTAEHERFSKGTPVRCCSLMETVTSLSIIPCEQERLT
ncbi:MAG: D-glycero-alpha-D-manno-heptose-1,7-bisphosphate 7-phosphatase [Syntrophobacteraceae bacterium]